MAAHLETEASDITSRPMEMAELSLHKQYLQFKCYALKEILDHFLTVYDGKYNVIQ